MADGISAVDIGMLLFDVEPDAAPPAPSEPWRPRRTPSHAGLGVRAATGVLATLRRLAALADPRRPRPGRRLAPRRRRPGRPLGGHLEPRSRPRRGSRSTRPASARGASSPGRTFDLAEFKRIKNALGGTVNDVSLAVATGALRAWLAEEQLTWCPRRRRTSSS